jgi:hypothetical protein
MTLATLSGYGDFSPFVVLTLFIPFLISLSFVFREYVVCGKQESCTSFQPSEPTIPTSHPDCNPRDTIFLVSSQLYTCTLYSTTPQLHTLSLSHCRLVSLLCYCLEVMSVLEWHIGFLLALGGWMKQTVFDERISSQPSYMKGN